jgi:hypothetical protein
LGGKERFLIFKVIEFLLAISYFLKLTKLVGKATRDLLISLFLWCRTGSPFLVFNTHLDHMSQEARLEGLKLILSRITTLSMGLPAVLLGDFNSPPREGLVDKITQNNAKHSWGKCYCHKKTSSRCTEFSKSD